jgi:hypothetical protein
MFHFACSYLDVPDSFTQELIRAVIANCNPQIHYPTTYGNDDLQLNEYICSLFKGLAGHTGLKTIKVNVCTHIWMIALLTGSTR